MTSLQMNHLLARTTCALVDLTDVPRVGFRGGDSASYLGERGFEPPQRPNQCLLQADGSRVARLSQSEFLLLGSLCDHGQRVADEEAAWEFTPRPNYLLPRQDSHAWLQLSGPRISEVMAKVCGVDLRPAAFAPGDVAQTSVARVNTIVINAAVGELPCLYLLADRCSLEYFSAALLDAMAEFGGEPVGLDELLR